MQGQQLPQGMFVEDAQAIQRRRAALAGIMAQAAPQQGRMVGGRYIRGNGLSQIAALIAGAMSKDNTSQMETDARAKYQADLRGGMEDYFTQRNGRSGAMNDQQALDLMENDQAPILPEPITADPRAAVVKAMSSRHPELQKIGIADFERMNGPKARDIKEAGGQFFDLSSGKPVPLGGVEYGDTLTIGGDLYQRGPGGQLKKLDNAPKITLNNLPPAAGMKKYQEKLGESLAPGGASSEAAAAAQESLASSVEALQAVNDGAKQGIAEPALQVVRKLGAQLGIPNAATAPTDALSAALKGSVFKSLGGLGAQISNSDRDFVMSFAGDLTTDPFALKRMLAISIASQMKKIARHNRQAEQFGAQAEDPDFASLAGNPLNVVIPDDEVAAMVDNVMQGKPTTAGMAQRGGSTSARPQPAAPSAPIIKNW